MHKRIIISIVVVIILAGIGVGGWYFLSGKDSGSDKIAYVSSVQSIVNANSGLNNRFLGAVETQETKELNLADGKELDEIFIEAGDSVDVGTELFSYKTDTMEEELDAANLALERIDYEITSYQSQIAQLEKEKAKASNDEKLNYTLSIQEAELELKSKEYEKKSKAIEIEQLKSSIENTVVKSDIAGTVKSINREGGYDSNGNTLAFMTIVASGDYRIAGSVNEYNMSNVYQGMEVLIRSRTDKEQTWQGTVTLIDYENPKSSSNNSWNESGDTSMSYPFYVAIADSTGLKLGQHVYIEPGSGQEEEKTGIWLDAGYIIEDESGSYVWAEGSDGKLEKRAVKLGGFDENYFQYQIDSGLTLEDYIAYPQAYLEEGLKVAIGEYSGEYETGLDEGEMYNEEGLDGNIDGMDVFDENGEVLNEGQLIDGEDGQIDPQGDIGTGDETE